MPIVFVDHTATGAADGSSWTDAYTTLAAADSVAAAGDEIRIKDTHAETLGATTTYDFTGGTPENPVLILSVTEGASAAGANDVYNAGATFSITGAYDANIDGHFFMAGITFTSSSTATQYFIGATNDVSRFYECTFVASAGTVTYFAVDFGAVATFDNCTFDVAYMSVIGEAHVGFYNCSITTDHTGRIFQCSGDLTRVIAQGCAFTNTGGELVNANETYDKVDYHLMDCSFSTALTQDEFTTGHSGQILIERSTESTNVTAPTLGLTKLVNHRGTITSDSTITRNASDGTTAHTWKMAPNTNVKTLFPLKTPLIAAWATTTDTTVRVNVTSDTALTDAQFWIEVTSPNETANPNTTNRGKWQSTQSASSGVVVDPLKALGTGNTSPVALTTRFGTSTGWGGTSKTTKTYVEVTIAPAEDGPVQVWCCVGADVDVWVEPLAEIT